MHLKFWLLTGLSALALTACGQALQTSSTGDAASPTAAELPMATHLPTATKVPTSVADAPPTLLPEAPPPGAGQFKTDFSQHSVPYGEILSGGPPKDGILAIDNPQFISVGEADAWLKPQEPVILLQLGDDVRAYPIQILMWHEIINDTVGGVPVIATFCPLCNTAIAFDRTLDGRVLDFGTTGRLQN